MKRTRALTHTVAVLVAGLLAGTSGCTSAPDDPGASGKPKAAGSATAASTRVVPVSDPEALVCRGGTYTWFNTRHDSVLNGVTPAQRVTSGPTELSGPMRRLRTDRASVESEGPGLDSNTVLFALARHLGVADENDDPEGWSGMGQPGDYAELDTGGSEMTGDGRLVEYSWISLVETDFRHRCGHGTTEEPTVGHVVSWTAGGAGILDCEEPLTKGASAAAREAVRLSCGR